MPNKIPIYQSNDLASSHQEMSDKVDSIMLLGTGGHAVLLLLGFTRPAHAAQLRSVPQHSGNAD